MFKPLNNYVTLEELKKKTKKTKESTILIPDSYTIDNLNTEKFKAYKLVGVSSRCLVVTEEDVGKNVLVLQNSIEKIKTEQCPELFLLSETYIMGIIE